MNAVCPGMIVGMTQPLMLSTWSFGVRGNEAAFANLAAGGSSLDAVERACITVETDLDVDSVGFGGLPDQSGSVTLDGAVMLAPHRCGSVCHVRRFLHVASIARKVMEETPHVMLVGDGADAFAEQQGFMPADLLSADASDMYQKWKREPHTVDQSRDKGYVPPPRPVDQEGSGRLFQPPPSPDTPEPQEHKREYPREHPEQHWKYHDTICTLAIDAHDCMAGAASTSGMPFKLPGRVGDAPIIGHGLYVDPAAGAAVATGTGELVMGLCSSFLAVELMRQGASPLDAVKQSLQRIVESFDLEDHHQVAMIALKPDGSFATAALRSGYKTAVTNEQGSRIIEPEWVAMGE